MSHCDRLNFLKYLAKPEVLSSSVLWLPPSVEGLDSPGEGSGKGTSPQSSSRLQALGDVLSWGAALLGASLSWGFAKFPACSFIQRTMGTCCVPGPVLGVWDTAVNKSPCPWDFPGGSSG